MFLDLPAIVRNRRFKTILNYMSGIIHYAEYGSTQSSLISYDFSTEDLAKNSELVEKANKIGFEDVRTINWFVPHFKQTFGGIYTALRFANHFQQEKRVENRLIVCGNQPGSKTEIEEAIGKGFGKFGIETIIMHGAGTDIPYADACIATCWESAYPAMKFNDTRRKFYFIQDFEPLFFPGGLMYGLAEMTYHFGFYAITNTKDLCDLYSREYGGVATYFTPSLDRDVFFPSGRSLSIPSIEKPFNIFFYTRIGKKRNAFELGTAALIEIKKKYGGLVRIFAAGDIWKPSLYGLEDVVVSLGVLPYKETANLYRRCDLGIFLGYTKGAPYIPLELMACGCPVLVNYNPENDWFYKDLVNCLVAPPSVSCILEKVDLLMNHLDLRRNIISNALESLPRSSWEDEMGKIFDFMCNPKKVLSH